MAKQPSNITDLVKRALEISPFSEAIGSLDALSDEDWLEGRFFLLGAGIEERLSGYKSIFEAFSDPSIGTKGLSTRFSQLESARADFWRHYEANADYLLSGMLLAGVRLSVVRERRGSNPDLLRPDYLLLAKASYQLSKIYFDKGDIRASRGLVLFASRYAKDYICSLTSRGKLEDSYSKGHLSDMSDILIDGKAVGSSHAYGAESALKSAIGRYSPRGQQWKRFIE